jgi:hypothetical protein
MRVGGMEVGDRGEARVLKERAVRGLLQMLELKGDLGEGLPWRRKAVVMKVLTIRPRNAIVVDPGDRGQNHRWQ